MAESKLNNISVFKFFEMSLNEFKQKYNELSDVARKTLDESICFIHPEVKEGEEDQGNGYMYAHGKYYNMSLDAHDLQTVLTTGEDEPDIVTEVVPRGGSEKLTPMDRLRLRPQNLEWIEIATDEDNEEDEIDE